MKNIESDIKKILRRNLIADFIEVFSLMVILLPLIIFLVAKASIVYILVSLTIFILFFYYLSRKDIQKIQFANDKIVIIHLFRLKHKLDFISYSFIKSITYSSTPSGFSSVTISYLDNNQQKTFVMNGRGITRKNKTNFIAFFMNKNGSIKFNGF